MESNVQTLPVDIICRNRLIELEDRLIGLEDKIGSLEKIVCKRPEPMKLVVETSRTVPDDWMYMNALCNKFNFMSITSLRGLIKQHGDFFKGHVVSAGRMIYVDPLTVCALFEQGKVKSPQLNRTYRLWKKADAELGALAKRASELKAY